MSVEFLVKRAKRWIVPSIVTAASLTCALSVNSQPVPGGHTGRPGGPHAGMHMMPPFTMAIPSGNFMMPPPPPPLVMEITALLNCEEIELTDEQISRLAEIKRATHSKIDPVFSRLRTLERDYKDALISGKDTSGLKEDILAQKKTLDSAMLDSSADMVSVLTPDQKKKLKLAMDKRELFPFPGAGPKPPFSKECKSSK